MSHRIGARFRQSAFTLIELITVMAITAILMTLIVIPLVQSINISRQAAAFAEAQDRSRRLGEQIAREISNSAGVRDNSGMKGSIAVSVPSFRALTTDPQLYSTVLLPYGKLDLLKPAEGDPSTSGFINPTTGKIDPTLRAPKGQIVLPVAPGSTIVRYWIGLRNPLKATTTPGISVANPYHNPYNSLLAQAASGDENLFVLWRAEVQPYVYDAGLGKYVVNKLLFYDTSRLPNQTVPPASYITGESAKARQTSLLLHSLNSASAAFDYPDFFDVSDPTEAPVYSTAQPGDPTKAQMIQNWINAGTVVSGIDHSDMIQPIYDKGTQTTLYGGANPLAPITGDPPRILPLVQFKPTRVSSEPATGQTAVRQGEESDNANLIAPDVYKTQYAAWSNPFIRTYPDTWDRTKPYNVGSATWPSSPPADLYLIGRSDPSGAATAWSGSNPYIAGDRALGSDNKTYVSIAGTTAQPNIGNDPISTKVWRLAAPGLSVFAYSPTYLPGTWPSLPFPQTIDEATGGKELFDIASYLATQAPDYAFSQGVTNANTRSGWMTDANVALLKAAFVPYVPDSERGRLLASFGINEVGDAAMVDLTGNANNLPQTAEALADGPVADSPATDAIWSPQDPAAFAASPTKSYDINRCFNRAWNNEGSALRPDIHRFIDLRVVPSGSPTNIIANDPSKTSPWKWASPLDPTYGYPRARIVPGSEQVFGPDQNPGPNYGQSIQYSRTTRNPGPNQYQINYVDQPEPDYTLLGVAPPMEQLSTTTPPYKPYPVGADFTDPSIAANVFTSTVIEPRFKAGYIHLNSDPNVPLPVGTFQVYYRFQFTHAPDVFAVDYDSRELMSVLLTVKNFPQQGLSMAQNVTIPVTAKVRNFLR